MTRVMYPYAGRVDVSGRVGALIEIKAGIHPDLTGRENIFLYGSLLGLARQDVARRFDEIVDFAELHDAVDRQVKFYSSGMEMRLGFGVAAFLEPDVLLVDEVMAVGDASFQQKCLSRMREVLAAGTTLFFVSHDLATIEAVCDRGIWLHEGEIAADGPLAESLGAYRGAIEQDAEQHVGDAGSLGFEVVAAERPGGPPAMAVTGEPLLLRLAFNARRALSLRVDIGVTQGPAAPIFTVSETMEIPTGPVVVEVLLASLPLPSGRYYVWGAATPIDLDGENDTGWHPMSRFDVDGPPPAPAVRGVTRLAPVYVDAQWSDPLTVARPTRHEPVQR